MAKRDKDKDRWRETDKERKQIRQKTKERQYIHAVVMKILTAYTYMYTMITKFFFLNISIVWHNPENVKGIKHSIFDFVLPLVTNLLKSLNWGWGEEQIGEFTQNFWDVFIFQSKNVDFFTQKSSSAPKMNVTGRSCDIFWNSAKLLSEVSSRRTKSNSSIWDFKSKSSSSFGILKARSIQQDENRLIFISGTLPALFTTHILIRKKLHVPVLTYKLHYQCTCINDRVACLTNGDLINKAWSNLLLDEISH